jgi:KUP system potassium uptake protein
MVPSGTATFALVALSSAATVIASQALISGAFSLTRQAMQLGYFPRVTIRHTAAHTEGQIYIPEINWLLAVACLLLVLGFHRSDRLASAYGIAVTGTMMLTSLVYFVVMRQTWHWSLAVSAAVLALFLSFDVPFFLANTVKILDGGWVPVLIGVAFIASMLVWSRGRTLIAEEYLRRFASFEKALPEIRRLVVARVPGTGIFMTSSAEHVPPVLLHLVKRGRALHQQVLLLTVLTESIPSVKDVDRLSVDALGDGFYRVVGRYGFMEHPDVPRLVAEATRRAKIDFSAGDATYFLGRETVLATDAGAMGVFAESLYGFLQRNAVAADRHFQIPPEQAIEIGIQMDL